MIWEHVIPAGHVVPLEPNRKVFGNEKDGYFVITPYSYGSHWKMRVVNACAITRGKIEHILTKDARGLENDSTKWRLARNVWPDQYVAVDMRSPCCAAKIDASLGDGIMIGSCSKCHTPVVRQNPKTGAQEWLDGCSPWTQETLRVVPVVA